jgi:hypothetical protein
MPSDVASASVVIRRKSLFQEALPWTVLVDDQEVGTLPRYNSSLTVPVPPGHHAIVISRRYMLAGTTRGMPYAFDVEAGAQIYLVTRLWMFVPRIRRRAAPRGTAGPDLTMTTASPSVTANTTVILEGARYEVPLGDETRTIDNSKSASSTMRVVRLSREWTKKCTVDVQHVTTAHGSLGVGILMMDLKLEAERMLSKTYATATEERQRFQEEVTLNIAQHTKSKIVFSWKEIRQRGTVRIARENFEAQIPYEAVVGLTFDQQQIDMP